MANRTDGTARVKGSKKNLLKFVEILKREKEGVPYLPRTIVNWFEMSEEEIANHEEEEFSFAFDVDCAWSVVDCWLNYGLDERDPMMQHITTIAEDLNLEIKVLAAEPGMYFIEYLHIDKGWVKAEEYWAEEDAEKMEVDCPEDEKSWEQLYALYSKLADEKLYL